jgi:uncharacterized membrane protein
MHLSPQVFWPYFGGAAALLIGIFRHRKALGQARGAEMLLVLAPVFVAIAMAVFGADHLSAPRNVAQVVPVWMPWRLFWAVFVGLALVAAAAGLAADTAPDLAAGLLGAMIGCFALLIFLPWWLKSPGNPFRITLLLRDLTLGSAFLAYGLRRRPAFVAAAQRIVAIGLAVYGAEQALHPLNAPGIPPDGPNRVTLPAWIPAHAACSYLCAAIFILAALALATGKQARRAAFTAGATVSVLILIAYLPWTIAQKGDVDNGLDYVAIHFALAGALLLLSAALPRRGLL